MKKKLLILILVIFELFVQAQTDFRQIASKLSSSNYVFEGIVESIEFFAGDKQANKLPASSVKWENGGGYFYNADGSEAKGYSVAKIKLYKVYKGADLTNSQYAYILSSTDGLQVFLTTNGKDTIINHMNFAASHDENFLITPSMKNFRMIFFANKNTQGNFVVLNKTSVVYFNSSYSEKATNDIDKILASIEDVNLNSYTELNQFLGSISGINVNAKEKFEIGEKKTQMFPTSKK